MKQRSYHLRKEYVKSIIPIVKILLREKLMLFSIDKGEIGIFVEWENIGYKCDTIDNHFGWNKIFKKRFDWMFPSWPSWKTS